MIDPLATAKAQFQAGNRDGARRAAGKVLEEDPESLEALHFLAQVELEAENFAKALQLMEQALAKAPNDPNLRSEELYILMKAGKKRRSRLGLKRFEKEFPYSLAHIARLKISYENHFGSDRKAVKKFSEWARPGNEAAEGVLRTTAGELWAGQRLLRIALRNDPNNAYIAENFALNQFLLSKPTSARRAARQALAADPTNGSMRWLKMLTWLSYYPSAYFVSLVFTLVLLCHRYVPLAIGAIIFSVMAILILGSGGWLETVLKPLGMSFLYLPSVMVTIAYFAGWLLLPTQIPDKLFASKRKVNLRDY